MASFLSQLFGGSSGNSGDPSHLYAQSAANAQNQAWSLKDAFFGSNWRKSMNPAYGNAGSSGIFNAQNAQAGNGAQLKASQFNYTPQAGSAGFSAGGGGGGGAGAGAGGIGGGLGRNNDLYGGNTPYGNAPILQQLLGASARGIGANAQTLSDFNQGSEGAMREAQNFGTGQGAVIESDAAKALKDANAATQARLQGMGLGGSTITTDALGANSAGNLRELARAKANLAQQATGLKLQQRNTNVQGRANLQNSLNQNNQYLRNLPIQSQLQVLMSGVNNPFSPTGGTTTPGQSGVSGFGSLLGELGGFALGGPAGANILGGAFSGRGRDGGIGNIAGLG